MVRRSKKQEEGRQQTSAPEAVDAADIPPLTAGMRRDPCVCWRTESPPPLQGRGGWRHEQCTVCQAWEAGWVLVDGQQCYRVQRWVVVNEKALHDAKGKP